MPFNHEGYASIVIEAERDIRQNPGRYADTVRWWNSTFSPQAYERLARQAEAEAQGHGKPPDPNWEPEVTFLARVGRALRAATGCRLLLCRTGPIGSAT